MRIALFSILGIYGLGADTLRANMGSLYSSITGPSRPDTAMPTNVALFPRAVEAKAMAAVTEFGNFEGTGELSSRSLGQPRPPCSSTVAA